MDLLKQYKSALIITLISLLLTSCYQDFEPDIREPETLCLNALITTGEPVAVNISRTWRFSSGIPGYGLDINIDNATVELIVNGESKGTLTYNPHYKDYAQRIIPSYCSDYCPSPGDVIEIRAIHPELGEATAQVTMPAPIEITSADWDVNIEKHITSTYADIYRFSSFVVKPTFHDPADGINYYTVELDCTNPEPIQSDILVNELGYVEPQHVNYAGTLEFFALDFEAEPLFQEHLSILEQIFDADTHSGTVFSDKQINGQDYTLRLSVRDAVYYTFNPEKIESLYQTKLFVKLSHISPDYYDFLISQWQNSDGMHGALGSVGLADPIFVHSNVSTGAGIIATRSSTTYTIDLAPLFSQLPNEATGK